MVGSVGCVYVVVFRNWFYVKCVMVWFMWVLKVVSWGGVVMFMW